MEQKGIATQETNALIAQGIPMTGIITKDQATIILQTIWKNAPEIEVYKAAMLCQDFGLHPLMKHVYLIPYNKGKQNETWSTVLGISATRLIMSRLGSFGYVDDTPRIMSEEEQNRVFGEIDKTNVVAITRLRTKDGMQASGYGKYPKDARLIGEDKGNSHANMAFIRSERNAFSRLFPDANMPKSDIPVVDEEFLETPSGLVNEATGEIKEVPSEELAEAEFLEVSSETPQPEPKKTETVKDAQSELNFKIEMTWLIDSVNSLKWDILAYMREKYEVESKGSLKDVVGQLSQAQQVELGKEVQRRLDKR